MPDHHGPQPKCVPAPERKETSPRLPRFSFSSAHSTVHDVLENLSAAILPSTAVPRDVASRWLPSEARIFNGKALPARELSLATHAVILALLIFPFVQTLAPRRNAPGAFQSPIPLADWNGARAELARLAGGSGGDRNPVPATKGHFAPFRWLQLTPPGIIRNLAPRLPADATLVGPPDIPVNPSTQWGIPTAPAYTGSQGPGERSGYGPNCCGGAGPSRDHGGGGSTGPGKPGVNGVGEPVCIHCPDPKFTEDARKAKYQGTVLLRVVVNADGTTQVLGVARGLGMGLDENAVAAVRGWKFRAARGRDGKPVPVEVLIEVTFRLL